MGELKRCNMKTNTYSPEQYSPGSRFDLRHKISRDDKIVVLILCGKKILGFWFIVRGKLENRFFSWRHGDALGAISGMFPFPTRVYSAEVRQYVILPFICSEQDVPTQSLKVRAIWSFFATSSPYQTSLRQKKLVYVYYFRTLCSVHSSMISVHSGIRSLVLFRSSLF